MNMNEAEYWKRRDQIAEADLVWLAQRHVTNAIESLSERGYDRNSYAVRELQSIVDRLSKLAVTVQTGLEEDVEAYKAEDAKYNIGDKIFIDGKKHTVTQVISNNTVRLEEESQADHELDENMIRYAGAH